MSIDGFLAVLFVGWGLGDVARCFIRRDGCWACGYKTQTLVPARPSTGGGK